jgi:hypothetical protein
MATKTFRPSAGAILARLDVILAELYALRLTIQSLVQPEMSQMVVSQPHDTRQAVEAVLGLRKESMGVQPDLQQAATRVLAESGKFYMPTRPRSAKSIVNETPVAITGKPVSAIILEQRGTYDPI